MSTSRPIVELCGVAVRVGVVSVVRDVDFVVDAGGSVGLFGANGVGKTTLLRLMATLLKPSAGVGRVLGADLSGPDRFGVRDGIGFIGHVPSLYPELTLRENLEFVSDVIGAPGGMVDEVLEVVGLGGASARRAVVCSFGMQRRAEFARELMRVPSLLLLDEPHSALDASALGIVEHLVQRVCDAGGATVLVSHDRERVSKLTERAVELVEGTLR